MSRATALGKFAEPFALAAPKPVTLTPQFLSVAGQDGAE